MKKTEQTEVADFSQGLNREPMVFVQVLSLIIL